jgi:predicted DNA-binding transcriptional regulator AlpA
MTRGNGRDLDEAMIARIVAAVLRELGYGKPSARADEPEWMPLRDVNRQIVKVSRTKFWAMRKDPTFPQTIRIGRDEFVRPRELRAWLAEREVR